MPTAAGLWTSCCSAALDWVYPIKCGLCGSIGEPSPCPICVSRMVPASPGTVSEVDGPLRFRSCVFAYHDRAADAVRRFKYSRATSLGEFMASAIAERISEIGQGSDLVVPVPIHWGRRSHRGFNQAEHLCRAISGIAVDSRSLRRVRATRPQAGLGLADRLGNLDGAFAASRSVAGKSIILVDDVLTSGQTARECARVLLAAGAAEVGVVAFAGNLLPEPISAE